MWVVSSNRDKQILLFVGIFLLVSALTNLLFHVKDINQILTSPSFSFSAHSPTGRFDSQRRNNYVLFTLNDRNEISTLVLATFSPEDQEINFVDINPNSIVAIPYGLGSDSLAKLYLYGQSGYGKGIDNILLDGFSDSFAIPIDGYMYFRSFPLTKANLTAVKKNITGLSNYWRVFQLHSFLTHDFHSNLSLSSLYGIYLKLGQMRPDKFSYSSLGVNYYQTVTEEGTVKTSIDKEQFDNVISALTKDPEIEKEAAKVEVKNGTGKGGLATRASRTINNLGLELVSIDNAQLQNIPRTLIIDYSGKHATASRLASALDGEIVSRPAEEGRRGDIVVVIGNNYYQKILGNSAKAP